MTELSSNPAKVSKSSEELFVYLTNLERFHDSLPEQVTHYRVEGDTCSFTIQGMADLTLKITQKEPFRKVVFSNAHDKPFPFRLIFDIEAGSSEQECKVVVSFAGELNPMLAMLAKGPLQNFVELVATRLSSLS